MGAALKGYDLVRERVRTGSLAFVRSLALQDIVIATYLLLLLILTHTGSGPTQAQAAFSAKLDVTLFVVGLVLTRGGLIRRETWLGKTLYRLLGPAIVFISYFQLRAILPAVNSAAYDLELYAFDMRVFGYEPALAWDKFVTVATSEWFSFFYFGYFIVLAVYLGAMTFLCRDLSKLTSFALGVFSVFIIGQLVYMIVPGYGPYLAMADQFTRQLEGPTYWPLVRKTVETSGALKDIFPSLHTAVPTFFSLFTFRHRKVAPFKYLWPVVLLITSQIVIATMFLRWHYVIDVVAGLSLATLMDFVSHRVGRWEVARRERLELPPVFEPYQWQRPK